MEEQIKKIISDNYDPDWEELGLEKTAREIKIGRASCRERV